MLDELPPGGGVAASPCVRAEIELPVPACVVAALAHHASIRPHHPALSDGSARMSYAELDRAAGRLAGRLRALGLGADDPVGICLDRSFAGIVAQLAVLKAGAAFLPLDPAWPEARLRALLDDAGAPVVIGPAARLPALAASGRTGLDPEAATPDDMPPADTPPADARPDNAALAYVIYTSGSSGAPKGVEITHGGLRHLAAWHRAAFAAGPDDRASHLAGLGFDAAIWEVWGTLTAGATLVLAEETVRTDPVLLQEWLLRERIGVAFVPTALAEPLLALPWPATPPLRLLLTGGEPLHRRPPPGLGFAVVNNYGPTECTVVATSGPVIPGGAGLPGIGREIPGARIHLLDPSGAPVPDGATGEIWIGGPGVGRGYRNRPDLTEAAFRRIDADRCYRTGDLARRLAGGELAFAGRADAQMKLRGRRIEPDEITAALNRHPGIAASAVALRGAAVNPALVAYVVPAGTAPSAPELRDFLARTLPEDMIPARFARLAALPMTANGKLDRDALPDPDLADPLDAAPYRAPETPTEQALAALLAALLKQPRIGADDNFFLLGGHSLLGTQLVLRARAAFGVEVTLRQLFEAQTVAALAQVIERLLLDRLEAMDEDEAARLAAG